MEDRTQILVGNLPLINSVEDVKKTCDRYGDVRTVWIPGYPTGAAYVEYFDSSDAEEAVDCIEGLRYRGRRLFAESVHSWRTRAWMREYSPEEDHRRCHRRRTARHNRLCRRRFPRGYSHCRRRSCSRDRSRSRDRSFNRNRSRSRDRSLSRGQQCNNLLCQHSDTSNNCHDNRTSRHNHGTSRCQDHCQSGKCGCSRDRSSSRSHSRKRRRSHSHGRSRDNSRGRILRNSPGKSRVHSRGRKRGHPNGKRRSHSRNRSIGHSHGKRRNHSRGRSRGHSRNRGHSRGRSRSHSHDRSRSHSHSRKHKCQERQRKRKNKPGPSGHCHNHNHSQERGHESDVDHSGVLASVNREGAQQGSGVDGRALSGLEGTHSGGMNCNKGGDSTPQGQIELESR